MDLSVIIPVYNDEKRAADCIMSVQAQRHNFSYEIIVIDDCSDEGSRILAFDLNCVTLLCNDSNQGQSFSRNRGAALAKGKYLLFIDSDVTLNPGVISAAFNYMKQKSDSRTRGVQGTFMIHHEFSNWPSLLYNTLQHLLTVYPEFSPHINSSCLFIEKDAFSQLGGFRDDIWYMEDNEFSRRAQDCGMIFRRKIISFRHNKYLSFPWLFKQHFIGGRQFYYLNKNFPCTAHFSQKYLNNYFGDTLIKLFLVALLFVICKFFPLFWLALPAFLLTHRKTFAALYSSSKNLFFIVWGFLVIQAIAVSILLGIAYAASSRIALSQNDRLCWLKSNLRIR